MRSQYRHHPRLGRVDFPYYPDKEKDQDMTYLKEKLGIPRSAWLVLALLAATAAAAATAQEPRYGHHLLYNQVVDGDTGVVSQVFDAKHAKLNSAGADDFVIPAGNVWRVKVLNIVGGYTYPNGPATSENVIFYRDKNGKPGKPVANGSYLGIVGSDVEGEFYIVLPPPGLRLKAGTYWLSVQANMDYKSGYWAWRSGNVTQGQSGNPAVWENPANGFHKNCRTFTVETQCWPDGQGPGKYFAIYGGDKSVAQ
jgi:hypothetical protein